MDINVKGALHAVQACTPAMLGARLRPHRPDLVDHRADHGQTGFAHYGASKAAMLGLMRLA